MLRRPEQRRSEPRRPDQDERSAQQQYHRNAERSEPQREPAKPAGRLATLFNSFGRKAA